MDWISFLGLLGYISTTKAQATVLQLTYLTIISSIITRHAEMSAIEENSN